ncbi:hypothetical protein D3C72_2358480 [compost metagenome]
MTRNQKIIEGIKCSAIQGQIHFVFTTIEGHVLHKPMSIDFTVVSTTEITVALKVVHAIHIKFAADQLA